LHITDGTLNIKFLKSDDVRYNIVHQLRRFVLRNFAHTNSYNEAHIHRLGLSSEREIAYPKIPSEKETNMCEQKRKQTNPVFSLRSTLVCLSCTILLSLSLYLYYYKTIFDGYKIICFRYMYVSFQAIKLIISITCVGSFPGR
jgi:hypothetical protein